MAYKLQIVDDKLGLNFNVKYSNLSKYEPPEIIAKASNGKEVKERTTYQGQVLGPGSTNRQWVDDAGNAYAKADLTFWCDGEEVRENTMTKVFKVENYQPLANYTDKYVIDKYYELAPSNNDMKKDIDRDFAVKTNLSHMYKLWKHLSENDICARGEFCVSSRGFIASDGYIRPISIEGKWGLEIGLFKEEKIFEHLQEGKPSEIVKALQEGGKKRLKLV